MSTSRESESGLPVFMRVTLGFFCFVFCMLIDQVDNKTEKRNAQQQDFSMTTTRFAVVRGQLKCDGTHT